MRQGDEALRLARLRQRIRIDRTDLAARAELAREKRRAKEERQKHEEKVEKVHRLVRQYLQTMTPDASPVFKDIREKAPDEYFVTGRAYTGSTSLYGADFEIILNTNTGKILDYKAEISFPDTPPRRHVGRIGEG